MSRKVSHRYMQGTLFNEYRVDVNVATQTYKNLPSDYSAKIESLQAVIRKLRNDDLNKGHCFMIFDEDLPEDQAYYEYPDGYIRIEKLDKRNIEIPRMVIKVLNKTETAALRRKHVIIR